ncbi:MULTISPECIES: HutD family protein [Achromobacter]|uniref:HutD family protein n=1 Tax=Achromobacter spanius TaxID=217203 RepID=A0ABY8GQR2_9BURK|nr:MULTISPECIES: HutD family protein [Achromobacter]WAI83867.1 HutD family protein [Achromobacter spanius]WEX93948.1 HutD family protein [Achromobacter sp. SS2-2022]WFP06889.1 HutD family protein [Achromobacter spanius]
MTPRNIRLYRAADYPRMPWKNGGGITQEVACNPSGSSAAFDWRLSIADVAQDGGFSTFNGYQRVITVLEGQGIQLTVDGREQTPLTPRQVYAFPGDARVDCRLLDGAIRDFNLIYAPDRYQARLHWASAACVFHSAAPTVLVLSAGGKLVVRVNGEAHALPSRYDCLHSDGRVELVEYRLEGDVDACVIELTPR